MSRKIKYRVWDNENKSYNDPYSSAYYAMAQDGGLDFYCHGDHMREADPDVYFIEQCTGLTDKNGQEIYEGDIVNICGIACTNDSEMACIMDTNSVVLWDKRYARFDVKDKPESKDWDYRRRRYFLFTDKDRDNVEVIGNVHENRELLDGSD